MASRAIGLTGRNGAGPPSSPVVGTVERKSRKIAFAPAATPKILAKCTGRSSAPIHAVGMFGSVAIGLVSAAPPSTLKPADLVSAFGCGRARRLPVVAHRCAVGSVGVRQLRRLLKEVHYVAVLRDRALNRLA